MENQKVSKTKIISLLKKVAEEAFRIIKINNELEIKFKDPFYQSGYIWNNTKLGWIRISDKDMWQADSKNVLNISSDIKNITEDEKKFFHNCGFKRVGVNIIFASDYVQAINLGPEKKIKDIFLAARLRAEKKAGKIKNPSNFLFKKKKIDDQYQVEAFINKKGSSTLSSLILDDYELKVAQDAIKLFKNKKTTNVKILDFFTRYGVEVCKNVNASMDYGYGSYRFFYAQYKLVIPDQSVLDFKKILPILSEAYSIYMYPTTKLYLNNESSVGWALYTTAGGYSYVG